MCGIAGWVGPGASAAEDALGRMVRALAPRGPDGRGTWRSPCGTARLGHTRLAIIDPAGSPQPMTDPQGDVALTYNGECYNYAALRRQLAASGRRFRTGGDTEVVLQMYEACGTRGLSLLDGMYALGIFDARSRRLVLARDRVGIKPLYYWHDPVAGDLLFASDLRALLASDAVPRRLDRRALGQYLHFGYTVAPQSWIEGVRQLPPGHVLEWRDGAVRVCAAHHWAYDPDETLAERGHAAAVLHEVLARSVAEQLVADAPLGCFLSSGVDSAVVTGLAQRARRSRSAHVDAFTVRFWLPELDESEGAIARARELGSAHHVIEAEGLPADRATFEALVDALGEPFGDSSLVPTWILCRAARAHVKVALSGEGGDELFLGYAGVWKQRLAREVRRVPASIRGAALRASRGATGTLMRRVHKYVDLARHDDRALLLQSASRWPPGEIAALLDDDAYAAAFPCCDEPFPEVAALIGDGGLGGFGEQQLRFHLCVDLPSDCLMKVDRMSMACGLEVRVPLLANAMLDYAASLPVQARGTGIDGKQPLRRVAEHLAPSLRGGQAKRGFCFPLHDWLRPRIGTHWREWGLGPRLAALGFRAPALDAVLHHAEAAAARGDAYTTGLLAGRLLDLVLLALWSEREGVSA